MDPYNHSTPISIKLLILDTKKFEQWKFIIQQYLQHEHYALWEVIEFGDSNKAPPEETAKDKGLAGEVSSSTKKKGRTVAITTEDMQKRKNNLRFSKYNSAKVLWEAILKTFGGNEATKKTKKNQLKQQYGNFKAEGSETLEQIFNRKSKVLTVQGAYTDSAQVPTVSIDVAAASLSYDTICAFIAAQLNGSQIKYEDISQIDDDDIEEMDIKWNLANVSMRANRFLKKTSKKITIQRSDVASFEKSKVECFNYHKMGHFARDCRSPRNQDRGKRASYKKDPKVEEPAPKAMIAIDGIGWDWSYMTEEDKANLVIASKDLDRLLESQKLDKDKKGVGFNEYCVVLPPLTQVYSPPKKDLSWIGLPEFVDDTITDYTRPTPSIDVSKSVSKEEKERWKINNPSFFEQGGSFDNIVSKPMIKFVKESGCPNATKFNNTENARKPTVKYAEMYRNT
nr:hypothetical protein [Tanacetum cinerariifolium]